MKSNKPRAIEPGFWPSVLPDPGNGWLLHFASNSMAADLASSLMMLLVQNLVHVNGSAHTTTSRHG